MGKRFRAGRGATSKKHKKSKSRATYKKYAQARKSKKRRKRGRGVTSTIKKVAGDPTVQKYAKKALDKGKSYLTKGKGFPF